MYSILAFVERGLGAKRAHANSTVSKHVSKGKVTVSTLLSAQRSVSVQRTRRRQRRARQRLAREEGPSLVGVLARLLILELILPPVLGPIFIGILRQAHVRGNKEGINTPRARTEVASSYAGQVPEPP